MRLRIDIGNIFVLRRLGFNTDWLDCSGLGETTGSLSQQERTYNYRQQKPTLPEAIRVFSTFSSRIAFHFVSLAFSSQ